MRQREDSDVRNVGRDLRIEEKGRVMVTEYGFGSDVDLGHQQLTLLEELFDEPTCRFTGAVTAGPGQKCLDMGAGSGSLSRWLAERAGPTGHVTAVDIETAHLTVPDGVDVMHHDVNDGVPEGSFDVIIARLLLMHLGRRREILAELVDALAPGGWLVVADVTAPEPRAAAGTDPDDAAFFTHLLTNMAEKVGGPVVGMDLTWGDRIEAEMTAGGLEEVESFELRVTSAGGGAGCLLYSNYARQAEPLLLQAGFTVDDLERFHGLMRDPAFGAWFFPYCCSRGRKPVDGRDERTTA